MPRYLLMIYEEEARWARLSPEAADKIMEDHDAFKTANSRHLRGGNPLMPTATATTVRKDPDGGLVVTDGPFAETKEALGGYYLVEVSDLDEALAIAEQVPAPFGFVEVRPVRELA
ncbi:YciI family protein [Streptomyces gilvus]|uniref:YciI family protein n=1 Tax=Streptomyces gilvus TaxID=2920937 RepID=UPI001F10F5FB|nr:YciI family protein [Streptomyces sp. CME 23]MCH5675866.1 YciI family protein [Streptomyces sp. CME 23]